MDILVVITALVVKDDLIGLLKLSDLSMKAIVELCVGNASSQ